MSCCYDTYYVLSWLLFAFLQKSVLSQRILQVQLVRYENPLLLEFRPDELDGPYCCCNSLTPCSPFIEDFTTDNCTLLCQIRFTICAHYPSGGGSTCIFNMMVAVGTPLILFSEESIQDLFDGASSRLLLEIPLGDSATSDVNLTVTIEEQGGGGFDMIDEITVPIGACDLFSPSTKYSGIYGIANIILAYTILTTSEQYRNCVDPNTVVFISTQTVTSPVTLGCLTSMQTITSQEILGCPTSTQTITSQETLGCPTSKQTITSQENLGCPTSMQTTTSQETLGCPTSMQTITSHTSVGAIPKTESSSPPTPLSIVLIVLLCLVLLLMAFTAGMTCLIWIKISRMNRKMTTSNTVNAGMVPMIKKIFDPLGVMDEHDLGTDRFTLEPAPGEERPHYQEIGQHQRKHQQVCQQDGL